MNPPLHMPLMLEILRGHDDVDQNTIIDKNNHPVPGVVRTIITFKHRIVERYVLIKSCLY